MILLLHKKGNQNIVGNFRGITLLNTAYKLYAAILKNEKCNNEKLKTEVVSKGILRWRDTK